MHKESTVIASHQKGIPAAFFRLLRRWKSQFMFLGRTIWARCGGEAHYLFRLRGPVGSTGDTITLLIAGQERIADAYHSFFFARQGVLEKGRKISGLRLQKTLSKEQRIEDDILLWQAWPWEKQSRGQVYALEAWSTARLHVGDEHPEKFLKREASSTMLRRIKAYTKDPCERELCLGEADLEVFYRDFYRPLLERRHGSNAHSSSLELMRSFGGQTVRKMVMFLRRDQRRVAGMLLLHDTWENCLTIQEYGVIAECLEDSKAFQDLYAGLNYSAILWATEQSIATVSFGGAPNHLENGVYYYKKQWGALFERNREREAVCFRFVSGKQMIFLESFPLLCFEGEAPFGLLGYRGEESEGPLGQGLFKRLKHYSSRNVRVFRVLAPEKHKTDLQDLRSEDFELVFEWI
jgi:hypothetical protein